MRVSSCKHPILQLTTILLCCLLLISFRPPGEWPGEGFPDDTPPELAQQLKQLRDRNDLTGWIYLQIQWTAKAPISRSAWLKKAVQAARPPMKRYKPGWTSLPTKDMPC